MPLMTRSAKAELVALVQVSDSWAEPGGAAASSRPAGHAAWEGAMQLRCPESTSCNLLRPCRAGALSFAS